MDAGAAVRYDIVDQPHPGEGIIPAKAAPAPRRNGLRLSLSIQLLGIAYPFERDRATSILKKLLKKIA